MGASTHRRRLRERLARDDGFFFIPFVVAVAAEYGALALGTFAVTGAALTGVGMVERTNNATMLLQANKGLEVQMDEVMKRTEGSDDPRAQEDYEKAKQLKAIAQDIQQKEYLGTVLDVEAAEVELAARAGSKLAGPAGMATLGAIKGMQQIDGMYAEKLEAGKPSQSTIDYIERLNRVRFDTTIRYLEEDEPVIVPPVNLYGLDKAIVDVKVEVTERMINDRMPDLDDFGSKNLARELVLDSEPGGVEAEDIARELKEKKDPKEAFDSYLQMSDRLRERELELLPDPILDQESFTRARESALSPLAEAIQKSIDKVDSAMAKGKEGDIVLTPEDEAALKDGSRSSAVGVFISPMGPQPITVTSDGKGGYAADFPTLKKAPELKTGADLEVPEKQWKDWWDGSKKSCPFLYVREDGRAVAVNDIISVSRDPRREYVDRMSFDAGPDAAGSLEVSIREIRSEESFLDRVALSAVDVPDGYSVGLSPDGDAYSVRPAVPPLTAQGASVASLALEDGEGLAAYDGDSVTAAFAAPGPGAVLLLTVDGFEHDGTAPRIMPKRPGIVVEALADGRWQRVGEAHPRELADTTAFDLARFVRRGAVTVRVTSISCDTSVHQLIDRIALSSAPSGLARVRPLAPHLTGPVPDAAALLAVRDGRRVHLVPGQRVTFTTPDPDADAYIVESVGWYRELRGGM